MGGGHTLWRTAVVEPHDEAMMETQTPNSGQRPARPRGRLYRPHDANLLAGVAVGISRWLDVPLWFVRLAFVFLAVFGGLGLVLYGLGWLFMPREGSSTSIGERWIGDFERNRNWGAVALIAIAAMIVAGSTNVVSPELMFAAILTAIGVLMYRGKLTEDAAPTEPTDSGSVSDTDGDVTDADEPATPTIASRLETEQASGPPGSEPPALAGATPPPPPRPERRREPSTLGRWTVAAALLAVGSIGLFDSLVGSFDPSARHYVGTFVTIIGLGLLVGAWAGRARGLVFLGILAMPVLLATPFEDIDFSNSTTRVTPTSLEELNSSYEFEFGEAVIDLRNLELDGENVELTAELGVGQLVVLVPDGIEVTARAEARLGEAISFGRTSAGVGQVAVTETRAGEGGSIQIDASVGIGQVEVSSEDSRTRTRADFVIDSAADLDDSYDIDVGTISLDLSELTLERSRTVEITADAGRVSLVLPESVTTEVVGTVDVGSIRMPDNRSFGTDLEDTYQSGADPILTLEVAIDAGDLVVEESR